MNKFITIEKCLGSFNLKKDLHLDKFVDVTDGFLNLEALIGSKQIYELEMKHRNDGITHVIVFLKDSQISFDVKTEDLPYLIKKEDSKAAKILFQKKLDK